MILYASDKSFLFSFFFFKKVKKRRHKRDVTLLNKRENKVAFTVYDFFCRVAFSKKTFRLRQWWRKLLTYGSPDADTWSHSFWGRRMGKISKLSAIRRTKTAFQVFPTNFNLKTFDWPLIKWLNDLSANRLNGSNGLGRRFERRSGKWFVLRLPRHGEKSRGQPQCPGGLQRRKIK